MVFGKIFFDKYKLHSGKGDIKPPIMHRVFEINGDYNFADLDFSAYGWTNPHPNDKNETIALVNKDGTVTKKESIPKNQIYKGYDGTIIMHIDCDKQQSNYHLIHVRLRESAGELENNLKYEKIKKMIEDGLRSISEKSARELKDNQKYNEIIEMTEKGVRDLGSLVQLIEKKESVEEESVTDLIDKLESN
jgi:hypothetical protein